MGIALSLRYAGSNKAESRNIGVAFTNDRIPDKMDIKLGDRAYGDRPEVTPEEALMDIARANGIRILKMEKMAQKEGWFEAWKPRTAGQRTNGGTDRPRGRAPASSGSPEEEF